MASSRQCAVPGKLRSSLAQLQGSVHRPKETQFECNQNCGCEKPQRLIAEPRTKIRTAASRTKNKTNTMAPRIRFFSRFSSAWPNVREFSLIWSKKLASSVGHLPRRLRAFTRLPHVHFFPLGLDIR